MLPPTTTTSAATSAPLPGEPPRTSPATHCLEYFSCAKCVLLHVSVLVLTTYVMYGSLCLLSTLLLDGGMGGTMYCINGHITGMVEWDGKGVPFKPAWSGEMTVHRGTGCVPLVGTVDATDDWARINVTLRYQEVEARPFLGEGEHCHDDDGDDVLVDVEGHLYWRFIPVSIPFTSSFQHESSEDALRTAEHRNDSTRVYCLPEDTSAPTESPATETPDDVPLPREEM